MINRYSKVLGALAALGWATAANAQDSYSDPSGSGPIVGALQWLQGTLLGTAATVVAVIAVAVVGFLMLAGRMNWRYGATVIIGSSSCWAASIVAASSHRRGGGLLREALDRDTFSLRSRGPRCCLA